MGGVLSCCRDESSSTAAAVALHSVGTKNEKQNDHGNNGNNDNSGNDDNPYDENDDEIGSDIFFSARESFSQLVNELSYPPTSTPKSGRTSNITIDHPETLLLSLHDCAVINEEEVGNSSRVKRPTVILKEQLTSSSFGSDNTTTMKAGYPGELTQNELDACIEFRDRLRDPTTDPTYRCMVYLNVDIDVNANNQEDATGSSTLTVDAKGPEEEAFALCRFLRARQFNVDDTFTMMEEHIDLFKTCLEANNLWRSLKQVERQTNCPLSVFWNQFPMIDYGIAKNGSYVVYMKAGLIRLHDGFDCINPIGTPAEFVDKYIPIAWWLLCYKFCDIMNTKQQEQKQKQQSQQDNNTDYVVLAEAVIIVDLAGLQRSFFTARTMEFLKCVFNVIQCFPEILNRVVVVNTPYFFTFIWTVLKHFVDPRTVKKIGFFSSISSAKYDLLQLIDSNQLLNEYGGTNDDNMTYDDVLTNQMYRDNTNGSRFIIERYTTTTTSSSTNSDKQKKKSSLNTFELNENETAILTVYTQAKVHVDVNVEEGNNITTTCTKFLLLSSSSLDNDDSDAGTRAGDKVSASVAGRATTTTTTMTAITKTAIDSTENKNSNGNGEDNHQFGQPAATTIENSIVNGPGTYQLVAATAAAAAIIEGGGVGGEKEQYLLVVSIANK